jgi:hypothetical protein
MDGRLGIEPQLLLRVYLSESEMHFIMSGISGHAAKGKVLFQ